MQSATLKLGMIFDLTHWARMRAILIQNIVILILVHAEHLIAHLAIP